MSETGPAAPRDNMPFVSVIMANRNGAEHIGDAIRSVLDQTHEALELLVADDASDDESCAIVNALAAMDPRVVLLTAKSSAGPAAARNRALDAARGDWIAIVDADDLLHPSRLSRLLHLAGEFKAPAIADDLIHFTLAGNEPGRRLLSGCTFDTPRTLDFNELVRPNFGGGPNRLGYLKPLIARDALSNMRYRTDLRIGEDLDLLLRLTLAGCPVTLVPEALYLYRRHAGSTSHRMPPEEGAKIVSALEDLIVAHPELASTERRLIAQRQAQVARMASREAILLSLKSRHPGSALAKSIRHPLAGADALRTLSRIAARRMAPPATGAAVDNDLWIVDQDVATTDLPEDAAILRLTGSETADDWARLTARAARISGRIVGLGEGAAYALGFVPVRDHVELRTNEAPEARCSLVHIRCVTYKRPGALRRALQGLLEQTHAEWVCDVYDDDPDSAGEGVVADINDPRIRYTANRPRLRASLNIDRCFARDNPHGAQYFCILEDDNQLLPRFLEDNIRICRAQGVDILMRNQFVEYASGTDEAQISEQGLLDRRFVEGVYAPDHFRLAIMADIGVSHGGLFWTRNAVSDLQVHEHCTATLQEYLRTVAIREPIYIAMTPLAVWAENGADTTRNQGEMAGWLRRELALKRSIQVIQRYTWFAAPRAMRDSFLEDDAFRYSPGQRATGLIKSLTQFRVRGALPLHEVLRLALRGLLIRFAGRPEPCVSPFLDRLSRAGR